MVLITPWHLPLPVRTLQHRFPISTYWPSFSHLSCSCNRSPFGVSSHWPLANSISFNVSLTSEGSPIRSRFLTRWNSCPFGLATEKSETPYSSPGDVIWLTILCPARFPRFLQRSWFFPDLPAVNFNSNQHMSMNESQSPTLPVQTVNHHRYRFRKEQNNIVKIAALLYAYKSYHKRPICYFWRLYSKNKLELNLNKSWTRVKLYQVIVFLSVILHQLNLAKLICEFQKYDFKCKKKKIKVQTKNVLHHSSSTVFKFSLSCF